MNNKVKSKEIDLIVNGEYKELSVSHVAELLNRLNLDNAPVVVELNGQIISKSNFETTMLRPEDVIEIVQFVGGG